MQTVCLGARMCQYRTVTQNQLKQQLTYKGVDYIAATCRCLVTVSGTFFTLSLSRLALNHVSPLPSGGGEDRKKGALITTTGE